MSTPRAKHLVLVADDSEDDGLLLQMAFEKLDGLRLVGRADDGEELQAYLKGAGKFADRVRYPFPDILLLDLGMPRISGFDILKWLSTQSFSNLKVVVLSGS